MILSNKVSRNLGVDSFACNKDKFFIYYAFGGSQSWAALIG